MSIATEITRLQGIKTNIRTALVTQGIEQASSHNMADFSADILAIQGGSEGVYITVKCDSAYQGYDIILSANESELDRKQCPSSSIVNFFVSADNVTLPTTFTISNNHPDYSYINQVVSASMYGWYEIQILTIFTLFSKESGFADGYSLDSVVLFKYTGKLINSNGQLEIYTNASRDTSWCYIEVMLPNNKYSTLHFEITDILANSGLGFKTTMPTETSPYDQMIDLPPESGSGDDISFNINTRDKVYVCIKAGHNQWNDGRVKINKIWFD